jgi:hypothetical protein
MRRDNVQGQGIHRASDSRRERAVNSNIITVACRSWKPIDQGSVENVIKLVEHRVNASLEDTEQNGSTPTYLDNDARQRDGHCNKQSGRGEGELCLILRRVLRNKIRPSVSVLTRGAALGGYDQASTVIDGKSVSR